MTTPEKIVDRLKSIAVKRVRGNCFEDFELSQKFVHHWGRTLTDSDNTLFTTLTLHFNPNYTNVEFAKNNGYSKSPVNSLLVFNTVFGLTVEDLSEIGGPFLGVEELTYVKDVYPGDTVYASSQVVAKRLTTNRPGFGIVTWQTQGVNQCGESVITFKRANLVKTRS